MMEKTKMASEIIFENEFFKATKDIYFTPAGPGIEYGLSQKKSIQDTISELDRLYKVEQYLREKFLDGSL